VFEYWLLAAFVFGFIIVGITYMLARLADNPSRFMRNVLLVALTPTVLFVAIIELVVAPMWGTEAALRLAPRALRTSDISPSSFITKDSFSLLIRLICFSLFPIFFHARAQQRVIYTNPFCIFR